MQTIGILLKKKQVLLVNLMCQCLYYILSIVFASPAINFYCLFKSYQRNEVSLQKEVS